MDETTPEVTVRRAERRERIVFENLMQLYVHDFSEQWAGDIDPRGEVGPDGRFAPYPLAPYWRDADHLPYLIRAGADIAGFMLIDTHSHSGQPLDRNVAEFFVLRKHRRSGVGAVAAQIIFGRYPGLWEAAIARRNTGALVFWRKTVAGCAGVTGIEEIDCTGPDWNGPVIRFRIEGLA